MAINDFLARRKPEPGAGEFSIAVQPLESLKNATVMAWINSYSFILHREDPFFIFLL
jgi:hypothetical protein